MRIGIKIGVPFSGGVFSFTNAAAKAHYEALLAGGVTPNVSFARRLDLAFSTLATAGIFDELVLGCYFGSDGQVATGNPIPFMGTTRVVQGTFSRGANGWTADQTATQGIGFTIPDTRTGTVLVDTVPGGTVGSAASGGVFHITGESGTWWHNGSLWGYNGTSKPQLTRFVSAGVTHQTSQVGQSTVARHLSRNSRQFRVHAVTFGTSASKLWVDGAESFPGTTNNPVQAIAQTNFSLFARANNSSSFVTTDRYIGTIRSCMVFNRELTTTEVRAATVAAMILDSAPVMMIVEGDSTAEEIDFLTRTVDHWGKKLEAKSNWSQVRQVNVATSGMGVTGMDGYYNNWTNQCDWFTPEALGKNVWFSLQGGINDIGLSADSTATIYNAFKAYALKARNVGMKTMIHTSPVPISPTWDSTKQARLVELNSHIITNAVADGFDAVIDAAAVVDLSNAANRVDDVHANGTGNDLWATAINAVAP